MMGIYYTYQSDSLRADEFAVVPEAVHNDSHSGGYRSGYDHPVNSVVQAQGSADSNQAIQLVKPSVGRRLKQPDLMINNSRYMLPRTDFQLVSEIKIEEGLHLPARINNSVSYDWVTLLLLVGLALFAIVRTTWSKYISSLMQSTVNQSTASRMFYEKNNSLSQGTFLLDLLFYIMAPVFLFQLFLFYNIEISYQNFDLYIFCLSLILLFFLGKNIIYRFTGFLFEARGEMREFLYNADNFKRVGGVLLLPMVAVISFYPFHQDQIPVYAGVAVVSILYFLLVFRGFRILLTKQFSIFYLFLYFCTLEILPLVLLYKILVL